MKGPRTRSDLWLYIEQEFDLRLPYRALTPGHSTPFDFVADAFFHPTWDLAAWANRSGLKTLSASIVAALEYRFSDVRMRGRVLSGSEGQARNLYEHWARWCVGVLGDRLIGCPGKLLTRLDNGDFEILAASQKRVRGAKVQRLFRDEVDEIDSDVLGASVGMLASMADVTARTIDTSTWHRSGGPMDRLVTGSPDNGVHVHKWNVWEAIEQCSRQRHEKGRGCLSCGLATPCLAKAREFHDDPEWTPGIAAEACGLLSIDDAVKQFSQWSLQQWQAEAECRRPSVQGRVYPTFDPAVHVQPELCYRPGLPTWRAIDWGWNDFVCLWLQVDKSGRVLVVEEYWAGNATVSDNARAVRQRDEGRRIEATFCDPAGRSRNDQTGYSDVEVFKGLGIPCTYSLSAWAREVRNGIALIRSFLKPAAGGPRLVVSGRSSRLIEAFEAYRSRQVNGEYIDEPVKPQACDHPMDALRYYFVNCWPPTRTQTRQMGYV